MALAALLLGALLAAGADGARVAPGGARVAPGGARAAPGRRHWSEPRWGCGAARALPRLGERLPDDLVRLALEFVSWPSQVATSDGGGTVSLWSLGASAPSRTLRAPTRAISDVKFFPKGDRLVAVGANSTAAIWSAASGQALHSLHGHAPWADVYEVQVFPRGDRLVTVASDSTAIVWCATSGALLRRLAQPEGFDDRAYHVVRIFPDGERIVTGVSVWGTAIVWNVTTGRALHLLRQPMGWMRFLDVSPDGERLVTTSDYPFWVWGAGNGLVERSFLPGHGGFLLGVAFAGNGAKVVTCSANWLVVVWDVRTGASVTTKTVGSVHGVVAMPGGAGVLAFTQRQLALWRVSFDSVVKVLSDDEAYERVAVSASGEVVAVCGSALAPDGRPGTVVWNVSSGERLQVMSSKDPSAAASLRRPCSVAVGAGRSPVGQ